MSDDKATNLAAAILGRDAQDFIASELGRYLLGRAKQEAERALLALAAADPASYETMRDFQNKYWRAQSFEQWLHELVAIGKQAEAILEHQESFD